ncbi:MAG TPA: hypothetical protein PK955_04590, partial [Methanoregulaceae archaeon]|nr:hypothetical protein [Methanoregulaceae archaeon]
RRVHGDGSIEFPGEFPVEIRSKSGGKEGGLDDGQLALVGVQFGLDTVGEGRLLVAVAEGRAEENRDAEGAEALADDRSEILAVFIALLSWIGILLVSLI